MICPKCEKKLIGDFVFCPECGTSVMNDNTRKSDIEKKEKEIDMGQDDTGKYVGKKEDESKVGGNKESVVLHDSKDTDRILHETVILAEPASQGTLGYDSSFSSATLSENDRVVKAEPIPFPVEQTTNREPLDTVQGISVADDMSRKESEAAMRAANEIAKNREMEKPISTASVFFSFIFYSIPIVGLICLIISAFSGQKKSRKSLARALLIYRCILLSVVSGLIIWTYFFNRDLLLHWFNKDTWVQLGDMIWKKLF